MFQLKEIYDFKGKIIESGLQAQNDDFFQLSELITDMRRYQMHFNNDSQKTNELKHECNKNMVQKM